MTGAVGASRGHARLALFWAVVSVFATLAVMPYTLALLPAVAERLPVPLPVLALAQSLQSGVLVFLLGWLGLRLGSAIGLDSPFARALVYSEARPRVSRSGALEVVAVGVLGALVTFALLLAIDPFMPPATTPASLQIALWKRALTPFYGGIVEELLLRLGLMTVLAWLAWRVLPGRGERPPGAVYWFAILGAALLFGAGHLPAAAGVWPLTPVVVARTIGVNALLGAAFGVLYWRRGLEHAMAAHFLADVVLHVFGGS